VQPVNEAAVPLPRVAPKGAILFVDDDPELRMLVQLVLEERGYPVFTAANGRDAIDLLKTIPAPRLVISDLQMPIMDGWEFVRRIKDGPVLASVPVLVQSSADRTPPLGIIGLLRKPIDLAALMAMVERHCG
jgi:CheY-like chemotaxis protein